MNKILLQINGESLPIETIAVYNQSMHNSEYEIEMQIDEKNLNELENLLERLVTTPDFFNYNIKILQD